MISISLEQPAFVRFENPLVNINFLYDLCVYDEGRKTAWLYKDFESLFYVDGEPALEFYLSALEDMRSNGGCVIRKERIIERVIGSA